MLVKRAALAGAAHAYTRQMDLMPGARRWKGLTPGFLDWFGNVGEVLGQSWIAGGVSLRLDETCRRRPPQAFMQRAASCE